MYLLLNFFFIDSQSKYISKKQQQKENWDILHEKFLSVFSEESCPATDTCSLCGCHCTDIILCQECGPTAYFCDKCCRNHHRNSWFHQPKKWTVSNYMVFWHNILGFIDKLHVQYQRMWLIYVYNKL